MEGGCYFHSLTMKKVKQKACLRKNIMPSVGRMCRGEGALVFPKRGCHLLLGGKIQEH